MFEYNIVKSYFLFVSLVSTYKSGNELRRFRVSQTIKTLPGQPKVSVRLSGGQPQFWLSKQLYAMP